MSTALAAPKVVSTPFPDEMWEEASFLPCTLSVDIPVRRFTVRDLLQLDSGTILESKNAKGADVPVLVNTQIVGWAEFEVVGTRKGIRLTELA